MEENQVQEEHRPSSRVNNKRLSEVPGGSAAREVTTGTPPSNTIQEIQIQQVIKNSDQTRVSA